ncbi:helix-turn-helix domain-containing protein [Halorientalis salina]|uniref:helix-turn-helix domain-containing protein n=1 Tax=Halorientalis salina TaxID=2932266 RepID=UPI0010AD3BC5|nr:helix-turn-helix domain-containing protein [Halorientalis salina]
MTGGTNPTRTRRDLCVVFEVEPAPESHCPLGSFDGQVEEVRHQLVGDECHTDTTVQTDECACPSDQACTEVVHSTSDVDATCLCTVFGEFKCVPQFVDVVDGRLLVETYLSDRERLSDLVDSLKESSERLRLRQLKRIDTGEAERSENTVTLDLHEITEKQREAVAKAVSEGYYSTPRETSVDELADDFGISTSALSQRLKAVESKLATATFAQTSVNE